MKKMLFAILAGLILLTAPFWGALAYGKIENRVMCWKVSAGWKCMDYYASKIKMPDEGFSPDGDFPVINVALLFMDGLTKRHSPT